MGFEFRAAHVYPDPVAVRLSFEGEPANDDPHYLIIDRSEDSPDEPLPDAENIYVERDDQQFGGYGGITSVTLTRGRLTISLTPRMAVRMGRHETLGVSFADDQTTFREVASVLKLIFREYPDRVIIDP